MTLGKQIIHLARRAFVRTLRQPGQIFFALAFPIVFLTVIAGGLDPAARLPRFPAESFLAFMLAVPFVHGSLFTAVNTAIELGRDIETGFLNRLALTPVRGIALMLGGLVGAIAIGFFQFAAYFVAGMVAGVDFKAGLAGIPVLFALAALVAVAFGSAGMAVALRTGSSDAVQSMFPLFFVGLFLSSMNLPRHLIEADWFRWVATVNPVSYLIEGLRSLVITGWDWQALALGFGSAFVLIAFFLTLATLAFRERLTRT